MSELASSRLLLLCTHVGVRVACNQAVGGKEASLFPCFLGSLLLAENKTITTTYNSCVSLSYVLLSYVELIFHQVSQWHSWTYEGSGFESVKAVFAA